MSPDEYPPPPSAAPPASLRARVLADAPRLASNLPKPLAVGAVLAVGAGWIVLSASHVGRRDNWSTLPFTASWVVLAEIALVAALSTVVALARGSLMLGPSARRILWSLSAPVVATAIIALLVPNTTPTPSGEFLRYTLVCDAGVMIIGIPVLLLSGLRPARPNPRLPGPRGCGSRRRRRDVGARSASLGMPLDRPGAPDLGARGAVDPSRHRRSRIRTVAQSYAPVARLSRPMGETEPPVRE